MNKVIQLFMPDYDYTKPNFDGRYYALLETPCFPATYYFGPVSYSRENMFERGEWDTANNATSNFHITLDEAKTQAKKRYPKIVQ